MGKAGDTKGKILEMLNSKNYTLTEISRALDLAPSTVKQHLQEMEWAGAVRLVRSRKLKYYEASGNNYSVSNSTQSAFNIKRIAIPIAIMALIVIIGIGYSAMTSNSPYSNAQQIYMTAGSNVPIGSTIFTISDAPTSYNITGLFVTIQNVSLHSQTTGKWYNIPLQQKRFNLIELKNISTILSGVKLSNGSYNELVFHISNVSAVVNGTEKSVFVPTGNLRIFNYFNISNNGTTNWINIDFDLASSIHIAPNGNIILLPVLRIRHKFDSNISLNQSYIIISRDSGEIKSTREFGMDANGLISRNYTIPQNWSLIQSNGKLRIGVNGTMPIIIRSRHWFLISTDANKFLSSNYTNITRYGNESAENNWTVNKNFHIFIKNGMLNGFAANCTSGNGAISCNTMPNQPNPFWGARPRRVQ
jgi:DNA-binding transcriptional ArsR family regulator